MQTSKSLRRAKHLFLSDKPQPVEIRLGVFRGVKVKVVPADSLQLQFGLWEQETYKYIRRALRLASWFTDIGAGFGEMCFLFEKATKADPIIAVEPWSMSMVRENIELNGSSRIVLLDRFIGTEAGQLPLDDLPVPHDRRGFIKLDADTAELAILQSGRRLLAEARPLLLVETHSPELERDCCAFLTGLGYKLEIIPNAWWRVLVPEQRPLEHNRWFWAESA